MKSNDLVETRRWARAGRKRRFDRSLVLGTALVMAVAAAPFGCGGVSSGNGDDVNGSGRAGSFVGHADGSGPIGNDGMLTYGTGGSPIGGPDGRRPVAGNGGRPFVGGDGCGFCARGGHAGRPFSSDGQGPHFDGSDGTVFSDGGPADGEISDGAPDGSDGAPDGVADGTFSDGAPDEGFGDGAMDL